MRSIKGLASILILTAVLSACSPRLGSDKRGGGMVQGALTGAGSGALYGIQIGVPTVQGAVAGAGIGAVTGAVKGAAGDALEQEQIKTEKMLLYERERTIAQGVISQHYERRLELHPTRDIFPADLFFEGDSVHLSDRGYAVVKELAKLNKYRLPWSRLVVAAYSKAEDPKSEYARYLSENRSRQLVNAFVGAGVEPRRLEARAVIIDDTMVLDPKDDPLRYNQAVEIIPLDR